MSGFDRVDQDAADPAGLGEPQMLPRRAGVDRLVDAVAHHVAVADGPWLASAGPDDLGIGRRDGERADRLHGLLVEDRREGLARIDRLPHAARRGAGIVGRRVTRDAGDGGDAARARRPHVAEPKRLGLWRRRRASPLGQHGRARAHHGQHDGQHGPAHHSPRSHRHPLFGINARTGSSRRTRRWPGARRGGACTTGTSTRRTR